MILSCDAGYIFRLYSEYNINHALGTERTIIQPINFFMNTVIDSNGKIEIVIINKRFRCIN